MLSNVRPVDIYPPMILFVGWGRCGKDTAGAFFHQHLGLKCVGSTSWAGVDFMARKLNVPPQIAWDERHNHRQFWKDSLDELRNMSGPATLIRWALFGDSGPKGRVLTGVRDKCEVVAARDICKHIVWIDRPGIDPDPTVTFGPGDCTDYVNNSGSLLLFHRLLLRWARTVNLDIKPSDYAESLPGLP